MEKMAKAKDKRYRKTASKFAWFFRKEFVVRRMFEVLNGEGKPEYVGFRKNCEELFPIFLVSENFKWDGSMMEFMYDDDLMHIDVERAGRWFWWLGVVKESHAGKKLGLGGEGKRIYECCGKCGEVPLPPGRFCHECGEKIEANWVEEKKEDGREKEEKEEEEGEEEEEEEESRKPSAREVAFSAPPSSVVVDASGWEILDREVSELRRPPTPPLKCECGTVAVKPFYFCHMCGNDLRGQSKREATLPPIRKVKMEAKVIKVKPNKGGVNEAEKKAEREAAARRRRKEEEEELEARRLAEEEENSCPICMEVKDDVRPIPHWSSKGDISGHKMCSSCFAEYGKNSCPFCHEVSVATEVLKLVKDMIGKINEMTGTTDVNALAALWEHWQFFEMEYSGRQGVVERVGKVRRRGASCGCVRRACVLC